jgi:hypothetical protein
LPIFVVGTAVSVGSAVGGIGVAVGGTGVGVSVGSGDAVGVAVRVARRLACFGVAVGWGDAVAISWMATTSLPAVVDVRGQISTSLT